MRSEYKQGGTGMLIKIAYRNIWRNKRRTVFCLSSVGIVVLFMVVYTAFNDGEARNVYDTVQIYELGHVRVVSAQYEAENEYMPVWYPVADGASWRDLAAAIQTIPGVRTVFPRIVTMATLQESTIKHATLWGLDIENEMAANNFNLTLKNDGLLEGRWPVNANECAVGSMFVQKSGLTIGDRIPLKTVSAQLSDRMWSPVITGIFHFDYFKVDERYIIADIERLQRLLTLDEGTQQLVVFADDERQSNSIAASIQNLLGEDNVVSDWRDNYFAASYEAMKPLNTIVYLVLLAVASFLIINTVAMIIQERIKEIGMMGSLGMTRGEIVKVFFFESIFLAAIGASAGAFIGGLGTGIMSNFPIRMDSFGTSTISEIPISNVIFFVFSFSNLVRTWFLGVAMTAIITLIPSLKSAYIEPVEALRR